MARASVLILVMAATLSAAPAAARTWRQTSYSGESPKRSASLVDVDSIRRSGDRVTFTTMTVWETAVEGFDRSITERDGDCRTRQTFIARNSFYLEGEIVEVEDEPTEPSEAKIGTNMGGMLEAVCGRGDYMAGALENAEAAIREEFKRTGSDW